MKKPKVERRSTNLKREKKPRQERRRSSIEERSWWRLEAVRLMRVQDEKRRQTGEATMNSMLELAKSS